MMLYSKSGNRATQANARGTDNPPMTAEELSRLLDRFARPGVPKYTALRDAFAFGISSGAFASGDRVPNEQELASVLPISLGTIQRALRMLVEEGLLQRRPGQGSFIAERTQSGEMAQPFHCRFVDDTGKAYLPVFPKTLSRHVLQGPGEWTAWLGDGPCLEVTRRIAIGTEFSVHSTFVVNHRRLPVFADLPLAKLSGENFKEVIFRVAGQTIQRVDLFLRQQAAPDEIAKQLKLAAGTVCQSIRAVAFLSESDAIYYQQIFIPPNPRELHIVTDSRARGMLR